MLAICNVLSMNTHLFHKRFSASLKVLERRRDEELFDEELRVEDGDMGGAADERVRVGGQRVVHVVPHQRRRRRRRVVLSLFLKCMLVYDRLRETRLWDQTPDKAKRSLSRTLS